MASEVLRFHDRKLEMAMITYQRPQFTDEWLSECIEDIVNYNISLSVYDSSNDADTDLIVKKYNKQYNNIIRYVHLPSTTTGGYKYIPPILDTDCEYIMIVGDSRCHSVPELCNKVYPLIYSGLDLIVLSFFNTEEYIQKYYEGLNPFLEECFIPITCCGMTIFKTSVFDLLRNDKDVRDELDQYYKDKFGFAYMGYYLHSFANSSQSSVFIKMPWHEISPAKKVQHWNVKFYECWCDELCEIMDNLPNVYKKKDYTLQNAWEQLRIDSFDTIIRAKRAGGLKFSDYKRMMSKGYLQRVTEKKFMFMFCSFFPKFIVLIFYYFYIVGRKIIKLPNILKGKVCFEEVR